MDNIEATPEDLEATKPQADDLDCQWWRKDYFHQELAKAYALGKRQANTLDLTDYPKLLCTCLSELAHDAYGPGGPSNGQPLPPPCQLHSKPTQ